MNKLDKKDRVLGSLIGFAIGDAMGATTEFMSKEEIRRKYGRLESIVGGGWLSLPAGAVTDDTQMALCVYRAIKATANSPERTLDAICEQFRAWADTNPPDIGGACRRAIYGCKSCNADQWIINNLDRQRISRTRDLGNGGLMRCLVPCLLGDRDLAVQQSYLTHSDLLSNSCISEYFFILTHAMNGERLRPTEAPMEPTGHVKNTLRNCLFWYGCSYSFEDAIIEAVNDGGDADTIAALTGGLAGAYYGFNAIPEEWVKQLDPTVMTELEECADFIMERIG